MIGEGFQTRLHTPIVFAGDEDEAVGTADRASQCLQRFGRGAFWVFLVHAVDDRQADHFRIDELDIIAARTKTLDDKTRKPDAHPAGTVGTVEDENAMAHGSHMLLWNERPMKPDLLFFESLSKQSPDMTTAQKTPKSFCE